MTAMPCLMEYLSETSVAPLQQELVEVRVCIVWRTCWDLEKCPVFKVCPLKYIKWKVQVLNDLCPVPITFGLRNDIFLIEEP